MKTNSFQSLLQRFFLERLMNQMNASPCTISSYRDTFRLFLKYMKVEKHCSPSQVSFEMMDVETIMDFLNYLETVRHNSLSTLNNRLAAIHAFMDYVSYQNPEYLSIIQRVMAIPFKRTETKNICYLVPKEVEAILNACDLSCWHGKRDRVMTAVLYNTGVRVSELVSLKKKDVTLNKDSTSCIHVMGKGRKERTIPLWKTTRDYLTEFLKEADYNGGDYVFTDKHGERMTRSGVKYRLDCLVKAASLHCPSLLKKRVTPHVFRHTTAMHLLAAGIDISTIAIWLGHESIETTHKYVVADLVIKEQALAKTNEPEVSGFRYNPSEDILSFLDNL